jgi:hypothetical protein
MGKRYDAVLAALTAAEGESNEANHDANAALAYKFLAMLDAADTEDDPEPEAKS